MKLLELNFERTWRGGERQTIYNLSGFRNAGIEVALLCRKNTPLEAQARAGGYKVYSFSNILGALLFLIMKGKQFDVMHAQTSHILTYCAFTKSFHKAKIIFTRRVAFRQSGALTRWKYSLTDLLVAVSTAVKQNLEAFTGRQVPVISDVVVAETLDKSRAQGLKEKLGISAGKHIVGTIAMMTAEKDPLTLIDAIKLLAERRNDFVFVHIGSGTMEPDVREKIKEYQLQDIYLLPGYLEHVADIFLLLEVFVMSSKEEGLGSSVLDAFLYNIPVVSTDAGGLADLIHDGHGILCRIGSAEMIADGIDLLLNQPDLAAAIATKANSYAQKEHSLAHITQQYLELLR